jgi:ATP-dependent exoDNAse (exonuclease V) beta subunit
LAALLEALDSPGSSSRVRAAALTCFLGWSAERLAAAGDEDLLPLHDRIGQWATTLRDHGVAALWKAIESDEGVTARTLSRPGGERLITDLRHVTEMIHAAHRSGAFSLHEWLLSAILHAEEDGRRGAVPSAGDRRRRRAGAHRPRLQGARVPDRAVPVLLGAASRPNGVPVFHPEGSDRRLVAVGGSEGWDGHDRAVELVTRHNDGENMRLLYVALTRARHHVVCWWAATKDAAKTPLTRFLFGRVKDSIRETATVVTDARMWGHLDARVARAAGTMARQVLTDRAGHRLLPAAGSRPPPAVEVARFDRPIDLAWTRTSFSGSPPTPPTNAGRGRDGGEAGRTGRRRAGPPSRPADGRPSRRGGVREPGPFAVFEDVDLTAADRTERIRTVCERHVLAAGPTADPESSPPPWCGWPRPRSSPIPTLPAWSTSPAGPAGGDDLRIPVSPSGPAVPWPRIADLLERPPRPGRPPPPGLRRPDPHPVPHQVPRVPHRGDRRHRPHRRPAPSG